MTSPKDQPKAIAQYPSSIPDPKRVKQLLREIVDEAARSFAYTPQETSDG